MSGVVDYCNGTYGAEHKNSIVSPNYPQNYDNNEDCNWKITTHTGSNVRLQFTNFETESCCDKLKIYDGEDDGWSLLKELSGSGYNGEIVTTGNNMYIQFTSDHFVTRSGFRGVLTDTTGRLRILSVFMNNLPRN